MMCIANKSSELAVRLFRRTAGPAILGLAVASWSLPAEAQQLTAEVEAPAAAGNLRVAQRPAPEFDRDPTPELNESSPETRDKVASLISEVLEPEVVLRINPLRSKLIRTKRPVSRFSITRPSIAEVVQFSPTEFEIIGLEEGQTSLTLWFGGADDQRSVLRYMIKVSRDRAVDDRRRLEYAELQDMINEMFPNSAIQLIPMADKLIVRGQARDSEEATQIMSVLRAQGGDVAAGNLGAGGGGGVIGQGAAVQPFPGTGPPLPTSNLVDLMTVPGEHQVMLKVRIAELSRTALRELGVDFSVAKNNFFLASALGSGGNITAMLDGGDVELMIRAFSSNGYSKILAEPNLMTLSGRPATFIAGGQFAVPTVVGVGGASAVSTQFQGFGAQLAFTPTVIDKDRIRLQVTPTFSELNQGNSVNGVPGLNTRSASTVVDMREGQWLAIAGLLQDEQRGSKSRVPFLGDIPIVEAIFSRKSINRAETELIVLVSPELVHPLEAEQLPLLLPGMEVMEPDDCAFFGRGRIEGDPNCHHRSTVWPLEMDKIRQAVHQAKKQAKYQQSEATYFCGQHGFSQ